MDVDVAHGIGDRPALAFDHDLEMTARVGDVEIAQMLEPRLRQLDRHGRLGVDRGKTLNVLGALTHVGSLVSFGATHLKWLARALWCPLANRLTLHDVGTL